MQTDFQDLLILQRVSLMLKAAFPMQLSHVTIKNHREKYILLDMQKPKLIYFHMVVRLF